MKKLPLLLLAVLLVSCGGGGGDATNGSIPVVTTVSATSITPTNAILNGTVIPNGLQTQSWFEYGTDAALATYTASPKQDAGSGLTSQVVNMTWNGLLAGTTYYFRFCAENSKGYSKGLIVSFTTSSPNDPPTVATLSATSIGITTATLNGNVTPNGLATTAWFEWGTSSSLSTYTTTSNQSVGSGTTSQPVSSPLPGLTTGTTYYYRVGASNSSGTTKGNIASFITGTEPGTWSAAGSMASARSGHTATLLSNGKVLVAGGYVAGDYAGGPLSSAELYDPDTGIWSATGSMTVARSGHTATLLTNGKVLVTGGAVSHDPYTTLFSAEIYDPAAGTWSATGSMTASRIGHTATLLFTGMVLIAGGYDAAISEYTLSSVELYNPGMGTWSAMGPMIWPRYYHTATLLHNGKILIAAGGISDPISFVELYDPDWMGISAETGSITGARWMHTTTLLPDSKVLLAGGHNAYGTFPTAELFDSGSGIWLPTGSMTVARSGHTATLLPSGKVLVTGGRGEGIGLIFSSAELYNPTTGIWSVTGSMAVSRSSHTATLLHSGKVLVTGGTSGSTAELYNP